MIKWYKFIYIPISTLLILYSLIDLYLLTKFGNMINNNKNITINKNLPKFIKDYLLGLKEISNSKILLPLIHLGVQTITFMFILYLIILSVYIYF